MFNAKQLYENGSNGFKPSIHNEIVSISCRGYKKMVEKNGSYNQFHFPFMMHIDYKTFDLLERYKKWHGTMKNYVNM